MKLQKVHNFPKSIVTQIHNVYKIVFELVLIANIKFDNKIKSLYGSIHLFSTQALARTDVTDTYVGDTGA